MPELSEVTAIGISSTEWPPSRTSQLKASNSAKSRDIGGGSFSALIPIEILRERCLQDGLIALPTPDAKEFQTLI